MKNVKETVEMGNDKNNAILVKSEDFALRIIKLYQYLKTEKHERVLASQILRSGTSIGANVTEGNYAQTKADFYTKLSIALKEAAETQYWLRLLNKSGYISEKQYNNIYKDCSEIVALLVTILKNRTQRSGKKENI